MGRGWHLRVECCVAEFSRVFALKMAAGKSPEEVSVSGRTVVWRGMGLVAGAGWLALGAMVAQAQASGGVPISDSGMGVQISGSNAVRPGQNAAAADSGVAILNPRRMAAMGTVDARYASFNIEMVEVTGGRFWRPYAAKADSGAGAGSQPPGTSADLYQYRPPIDLSNARLVKLARELGPSYLRVSGTWANRTWFQDDDQPARATAPEGFGSVLTRAEWRGVLDFARATGASLVTSFAVSAGTRDAAGNWTPKQAQSLMDFTRQAGGTVAAAEFMNEPTFPEVGGAPKGYDAAEFARDAKSFAAFLRAASPGTVFLGPGGVGEGPHSLMPPNMKMHLLSSESILQATGPVFDAFSYHFYGAASRRCMGRTTVADELSDAWLDRTVETEAYYAGLRDKYMPGKPMWLTETAEAACGGDEFAGEFADVFRYLNQLGALAQRGVQVVMHNTLAASDYGLLDTQTLEPKPDYWATLEWKRRMGRTVLNPGKISGSASGVRVYAQCAPEGGGAVTVMALNLSATAVPLRVDGAGRAERATLTGPSLTGKSVLLNGKPLTTLADGTVVVPESARVRGGRVTLPAHSATFLTFAGAGNAACR